jgi:uncharacterized protein
MGSRILIVLAALVGVAAASIKTGDAQSDYRASIETWRKERLARLTSDDGWLTVVGLFWLEEGENRFGSDPASAVVLPAGKGPADAGTFTVREGKVKVTVAPGVDVRLEGKPVTTAPLRSDVDKGGPDLLRLGPLTLFVIERGGRLAIRLKDRDSEARRSFRGLRNFPIDPAYRVTARFEPYNPPKTIAIANVLGQSENLPCPGAVVFTLRGREYRLEPVIEMPGDTELFYMIRDATSGKESYGSGRYLYSDMPKDGKVVLDFNKAYTPPCGFTPFATCPLPPKQNWMEVRIEAGETYTAHH